MKTAWTLLLLAAEVIGSLDNVLNSSKYHSYNEMTDILKDFRRTYPNLTHLYSIGKSTLGRELWVLEISAGQTKGLIRPNVKLIGNIHGNEPVGKELLLQLAKHLLEMYDKNIQIKRLLNFARIHLLPSMNPDGFELAMNSSNPGDIRACTSGPGRRNYNNIDLNRNFPDHFGENNEPFERESLAIKNWMERIPFVLSASLHGGALVASYPYDNRDSNDRGNKDHISPDDDVFKHLSSVYANAHRNMHHGRACPGQSVSFPKGITNGAAWYTLKGGMQDFNYMDYGSMELTLELSCCKFPNATDLAQLWEDNKQALLAFLMEVHRGIRGVVRDEAGSPVANATLLILGRDVPFHTSSDGEFWRILLPNPYYLQVTAEGFQTAKVAISINEPTFMTSKSIIVTLQRIETTSTLQELISQSNTLTNQRDHRRIITLRDVSSETTTNSASTENNVYMFEEFPKESYISSGIGKVQVQARWPFMFCFLYYGLSRIF